MPNALINETSPYLLQHAHNPVDWLPWGPDAFARARLLDKPVLVSIGYAACHWCHVMEHESFEDEAVARLMNDLFVCVKVDREERPDVDGIYMQAVQALTGRGGWPLNVFLTPDGRPFYGGTYFPPDDSRGMTSWPRVLRSVSDAYRNRRTDVDHNGQLLTQHIATAANALAGTAAPTLTLLDDAFVALDGAFDAEHGGFGGAPKFPQSMVLEFLLRYYARTGEPRAITIVESSLQAMANGGIYDHLGGGFHRYSTDEIWLVPHFEKMLYDNALLARMYLQAWRATSDQRYLRIARETLDYLLRDMRHAAGGFFSSQDADSDGHEGSYYVWSPADVEAVLGAQDARAFNAHYGVTPAGNYEGATILNTRNHAGALAPDAATLRPLRERMLAARARRVPPATDDKVLTAWNALALRALAEAAAILDDARYREAAVHNATFLLNSLRTDGRLQRSWKSGRAHVPGYLEDYALLINALISLHEATFAHRWLHAARELADDMLRLFWDEPAATLFDAGTDHERLVVRPRDVTDNAVPSGSSAAAEALLRLGRMLDSPGYLAKADRLFQSVTPLIARYPLGFGNWLCALDFALGAPTELAIIGDPADARTKALQRAASAPFRPNIVLIGLDPAEPTPIASPLLEGRGLVHDAPVAYVCHSYACDLPTADPAALARQLAG